ncbi:MAG: biopolymer transport protein ExbD [Maribacter sp.]|jgi:biopolymer transport protein ExbD
MGLKKRNKVSAEFSMSSLTDIIFLLLIFFILTSSLVSPNALNLKLPSSGSTTVAPSTISVTITKSGEWYVDNNKTRKSSVKPTVRKRMKEEGKPAKELTLVIVAEMGVPIENVVFLMDMATRLNLNAILATDPVD